MRKRVLCDIIIELGRCNESQLRMVRGFARGISKNNPVKELDDENLDLILLFVNTYTQKIMES